MECEIFKREVQEKEYCEAWKMDEQIEEDEGEL